MTTPELAPPRAVGATNEPLDRLLALRRSLLAEEEAAPSPAVARALEMADTYLFLALSYLGYTEKLFPEEG